MVRYHRQHARRCIQNGYHMEFIENNNNQCSVPCVYITDFDRCPYILLGGVLAMYHYVQNIKTHHTKDDHETKYQQIVQALRTWFPLVDGATKSARTTYEALNHLHDSMLHTFKLFLPEDEQTTNSVVQHMTLREKTIHLLKQYKVENSGQHAHAKYLNTHGISNSQIQSMGGLKNLHKLA